MADRKRMSANDTKGVDQGSVLSDIDVIGRGKDADGTGVLFVKQRGRPDSEAKGLPLSALTATSRGSQLLEWLHRNDFSDLVLEQDSPADLVMEFRQAARACKRRVLSGSGFIEVATKEGPRRCIEHMGHIHWIDSPPNAADFVTLSAVRQLPVAKGSKSSFRQFWALVVCNPRVLVVVCIALAALLRRALRETLASVGLIAPSSTGKNTTQRLASLLANGTATIVMLNATSRGLERLLNGQGDMALFAEDAQGEGAGAPLVNALMSIGNAGARHTGIGSTLPIYSPLIFSAERDIVEIAGQCRVALNDGVFARVLEIGPAPSGDMFDDVGEFADCRSLVQHLDADGPKYAGLLGHHLLARVVRKWARVTDHWKRNKDQYRSRVLEAAGAQTLSAVNGRLLDGLLVGVLAGRLLDLLDVAPTPKDQLYAAFGLVFREHLERTGNRASPLVERVIESVRYYIQSHPNQFANFAEAAHGGERNGLAGFRRKRKDGQIEYLFFPEFFRRQFVQEFGRQCYSHLRSAGYLGEQQGQQHSRLVRIPNSPERRRFTVVLGHILRADN